MDSYNFMEMDPDYSMLSSDEETSETPSTLKPSSSKAKGGSVSGRKSQSCCRCSQRSLLASNRKLHMCAFMIGLYAIGLHTQASELGLMAIEVVHESRRLT
ncbi:hypothetical protein GCK32_012868 [Trichostrongylus colubriformis]|uniref:Uncharacterized protein n=1 Tax=Trichostrongylus colubriformis TaxID=6319 RepID=A0AAN8F3L0_TRICO